MAAYRITFRFFGLQGLHSLPDTFPACHSPMHALHDVRNVHCDSPRILSVPYAHHSPFLECQWFTAMLLLTLSKPAQASPLCSPPPAASIAHGPAFNMLHPNALVSCLSLILGWELLQGRNFQSFSYLGYKMAQNCSWYMSGNQKCLWNMNMTGKNINKILAN